jgi:hypothetical protein
MFYVKLGRLDDAVNCRISKKTIDAFEAQNSWIFHVYKALVFPVGSSVVKAPSTSRGRACGIVVVNL